MTALAEGELVGSDPFETEVNEVQKQHIGKMALKASGWILASAPFWAGGAVAGVELASHFPAHIQVAPDVEASAHLNFGDNTVHLHATNIGDARGPHAITIGRKHIGTEADIDATNLLKVAHNGTFTVDDIKAYGPMLADSRPEIDKVVNAEIRQLAEWATAGALAILGLEEGVLLLGRAYSRRKLRIETESQQDTDWVLKPFKIAGKGIAGAAALGLLANIAYVYYSPNHDQHIEADPVLAGTPFEGWSVSGNIEGPLNRAVPFLTEKISQLRSFTDTAIANANAAVRAKLMPRGPHEKILLHVDDLQGRLAMMWLSGAVAKEAKVDGIINSGDYALTGTEYDAFLVNAMRDRAGSKIPIANSEGAHDNTTISDLQLKAHEMVANGQVQHFAGLNILGVNVPEHAGFLDGPMHPFGGKNLEELAKEAAQKTCSQRVQIVFTHDKDMGKIIAQYGCAKLVDDGRSYDTLGPTQYVLPNGDINTEATSGSSGALKAADGPSIGLPSNPAVITFQKFNTLTNEPVSYQVLTINTDASATLSPEISFAVPYDEYVKTGRTQPVASPHLEHNLAGAKDSKKETTAALSRRR